MPSVGALAQAQYSGQLQPSYESGLMYQPSYEQGMQPWPFVQASQGFAQQVAGLIGGAATQVSGGSIQNLPGSNYPEVWVVSVSGEIVDPAQLFPSGVILSYPDECAVENALVQEIPGGTLSAICASGGTGTTPTTLAISKGATLPLTPSGQSTIVGFTPPSYSPGLNTNSSNTQANSIAPPVTIGSSQSTQVTQQQMVGGNTTLLTEDSLGLGLPNWAYGVIGFAGLMLLMEMGKR